jgi:hypothetical protein
MRGAIALLAVVFVLPVTTHAATPVKVEDVAHHPLEADFPSGGQLKMRIRSAEIHIVGGDEQKIAVHVGGDRGSDATDVKAYFERVGDAGELRVNGGPTSGVTITVQVPRSSNLKVHIFAGDVEVSDIQGDKDIQLGAGDLTIGIGNPADYFHVDASVTSGAIEAEPFRETRGGLFRSFEKTGSGKYKLVAHVGAGDLTLR